MCGRVKRPPDSLGTPFLPQLRTRVEDGLDEESAPTPWRKIYYYYLNLRPQSVPPAVIDGPYTCSPRRGASNAGDRHSPQSSAAAQNLPAALAQPAPARSPSAPLPRTLPPHRPPPPLPGPAPQPARSRPRWLRKERKNRKQNFLAADGHQLHILQMPPSKNKPAAAPPGRLTLSARISPLRRDCWSGRIPHSGAPPGAPLPDTPPPAIARSFALKLDPKWPGGPALSPWVPPCIPTSYHSRSSSWCLFQPCAPGFRAPLPQLLSPEVTLSPLLGVQTPPDPRPPRPSSLRVHCSTRPPARQPSVPSPRTQLLSQRTRQPRQLPRTFPGTQAGSGRQSHGPKPGPRLPVPSHARPAPGEAGVGVG